MRRSRRRAYDYSTPFGGTRYSHTTLTIIRVDPDDSSAPVAKLAWPRKKGVAFAGNACPAVVGPFARIPCGPPMSPLFLGLAGRIQIRSFRIGCLPQPGGTIPLPPSSPASPFPPRTRSTGTGGESCQARASVVPTEWCARCSTADVQRAERNPWCRERERERDNDWNKIFTAAAGAGP